MRTVREKGQTLAGAWIRFAAAVLVVWLATGCGTSKDIDDVEAGLVKHYIESLTAAGMTVTVQETCSYERHSADEPWHLNVQLKIDALPHQVADVLESEGMIVRRDREPMIVQQIPGNPQGGWNGVLTASGDDSTLDLVYNNATRSAWSGAVGWAEACPRPED